MRRSRLNRGHRLLPGGGDFRIKRHVNDDGDWRYTMRYWAYGLSILAMSSPIYVFGAYVVYDYWFGSRPPMTAIDTLARVALGIASIGLVLLGVNYLAAWQRLVMRRDGTVTISRFGFLGAKTFRSQMEEATFIYGRCHVLPRVPELRRLLFPASMRPALPIHTYMGVELSGQIFLITMNASPELMETTSRLAHETFGIRVHRDDDIIEI